MRVTTCWAGAWVLLAGVPATGQDKAFTQRYDLHVPPAPIFGARPERTLETEFNLPDGFRVVRRPGTENGLKLVGENEGGMDTRGWSALPTANGVKITWKMRNSRAAPLTGRDAFRVVELVGTRTGKMALSPEYLARRKRFLDGFYFGGLVAEAVEPGVPGGKVRFSDQTLHQGLALAAFATEAAIRRDAGLDPADAKARVKELLDAFDALDRNAEGYFGAGPAKLDGLFVRDDVAGPADPRLGGRFKAADSDWQNPAAENASPSGDQIFSLMFGLWCVVRYADDDALARRAKDASARLYDYAARTKFVLKRPDGKPTRRGPEVFWLASLLHGMNKATTGQDRFGQDKVDFLGVTQPLATVGGLWDDRLTQRLVADHAGGDAEFLKFRTELNSFALHLLLMALAPSDVWPHAAVEDVAVKCNHHLAELVYCQAHNSLPRKFNRGDMQAILKACPADGPRASLPPATGWQQDNRWVRCTKIGEAKGGGELFNGLDWMLLHNFDQLVYSGP